MFGSEYSGDISLVNDIEQAVTYVLDSFAIEISRYGLLCKVFLQDWRIPVHALTLCGNQIKVTDNVTYFSCLVRADDSVTGEIPS